MNGRNGDVPKSVPGVTDGGDDDFAVFGYFDIVFVEDCNAIVVIEGSNGYEATRAEDI